MSRGFAPAWLAARDPYDVAALDGEAISLLRAWADRQPGNRPLCLVDLGCGTGAGLRRALGWLAGHPVRAYAVDRDLDLLEHLVGGDSGVPLGVGDASAVPTNDSVGGGTTGSGRSAPEDDRRPSESAVAPIVADVLEPLDAAGGPADGTVDLVVSHAVADLLPLDRFATRVAALLRPGGLAHLALSYDGDTAFSPTEDSDLDRRVVAAYHRHMDRARERDPEHGGSTAGRRLVGALTAAGLDIVRAAPSTWDVRASDGPAGRGVLDGLIGFVVESVSELGEPSSSELGRWERARRAALDAGELRARVRHLDILARRP